MIVPDSPNLKIGLKRKDLVLGKEYVWKEIHRFRGGSSVSYRYVTLVDLLSGNRAVIQWDQPVLLDHSGRAHDRPPQTVDIAGVGKQMRMRTISAASLIATSADWDRFPKHWNAKTKRLEMDMTEIQGEQVSL